MSDYQSSNISFLQKFDLAENIVNNFIHNLQHGLLRRFSLLSWVASLFLLYISNDDAVAHAKQLDFDLAIP